MATSCFSRNEVPDPRIPRLAVVADFLEEGWPSMDLLAGMLSRQLSLHHVADLNAENVCPPYRRRAGRLPLVGSRRTSVNLDRLINRMWDYPRFLRRNRNRFDVFHIVDHSYAQLVHDLPADRTGVHCHDLDTFRCLLEPSRDPRPRWFRAVASRVLHGFQKAALIFYSTLQVRQEIEGHGLIDSRRFVFAPPGVSAEFTPVREEIEPLPPEVKALAGAPFLLHVGSCIPRKRIDTLLETLAELRKTEPGLALVKVGADWSNEQRNQIDRLDLARHIIPLQGLTRSQIAALYRAATFVLQPSESEGFGLPVIEALACGSIVIASDLPVLREVAGPGAVYCPVGDVAAWVATIGGLLDHPETAPPSALRATLANQYTWTNQARAIVGAYRRLIS
jgi:glycosyltransferase involved in cell wall biosynthesis